MQAANTVPILILGDAPDKPSGLGRIARDLAGLMHQDAEAGLLPVRIAQLGIDHLGQPFPWRVFRVHDTENWAAGDLGRAWDWHVGNGNPGVLLTVWDPARCFPTSGIDIRGMKRWGYFAVDADGPRGGFGGPGAEALRAYDRILGYGEWGARVLGRSQALAEGRSGVTFPTEWLPHGFNGQVFFPVPASVSMPAAKVVGCVAANQPRKDLGLLFETWALMLKERPDLRFWLHTDYEVKIWSISQLAEEFGIRGEGKLTVTLSLSDAELAAFYRSCLVTIAPGLGEGFGYPIIESLASGVPVVHGAYGGGIEWVPRQEWKPEPQAYRWESCYVLRRPVFHAEDFAAAALAAIGERERDELEMRAYCAGAVANLEWRQLWPRWRSWVRTGLHEFGEAS